jgi:hypothetical protein
MFACGERPEEKQYTDRVRRTPGYAVDRKSDDEDQERDADQHRPPPR